MPSATKRSSLTTACACLVLGTTLLVGVSCSSDPDPPGGSAFDGGGTSSGEDTSVPNTSSSGFNNDAGPLPDVVVPTCVQKEAEAIEGKRPVDIIFEIDNSISMGDEINEVENQINTNFRSIIEASGTDYRVIMLSNHGGHDNVNPIQKICVKDPLSGSSCNPIPALPAETTKFFHHNIVINSQDTFCQLLQTFSGPDLNGRHPQGWGSLLRPTAFKVLALITDDRVNTQCTLFGSNFKFDDKNDDIISATNTANTFESALFALSPANFGSTAKRNYVFHSIVGVAQFDPVDATKPHPPNQPLVIQQCTPSAIAPGLGYQALSKLTGGLRYPTCGLNYTTIFQTMAKDVVDKTVLACDYAMPANPTGGTIDPETAVVKYTTGNVPSVDIQFGQVANKAACAPNKFYIEGDRIKLCEDACVTIQGDAKAKVTILFGCLGPKEK